MARRRRPEEHANHEGWAIPYGDLVTLLLAFFVVMYAISSINEGKYRVLSDSLIAAFRQPPKAVEPIQIGDPVMSQRSSRILMIERPSIVDSPAVPSASSGTQAQRQSSPAVSVLDDLLGPDRASVIATIAAAIKEALKDLLDQGLVSIHFNELWLEVEIKDSILFSSGSAQLEPRAQPILKSVAEILRDFPNPIRVEGFTDDIPITTLLYPSNWELSTARASSVVRLFAREGVAPARMSALGHAEFRPVASNATGEGRAQNRRVVLVVMADSRLSFLMGPGDLSGGQQNVAPVESPPPVSDGDPVTIDTPS